MLKHNDFQLISKALQSSFLSLENENETFDQGALQTAQSDLIKAYAFAHSIDHHLILQTEGEKRS
ncbi:hypothetical protein [Metabacillus arenae]|uniref:Uncharacterized protein n=1 Tax=Metabacillus arenae TaxID=2771434 RepID=A0A926RYY1_9BACI|nr:hypothetical protein [Metabacillus arenae]MBD1381647.1 hypothetical protein [Metabacillus arenae]